jgi:DNA-directed RNA polymerase specialized sigma24 family protein
MATQAEDRVLCTLQPYLTRIAHKIVGTYYPHLDPDDVLQEMNAALIERAHADPDFLDQAPGYQTRLAAWRARSWCSHQTPASSLPDAATAAPAPDRDLALDVRAALATLSDRDRTIAAALSAGYNRTEIAHQLGYASGCGIRRSLVRIRAALAPCLNAA